ncbi:MAG TPA: T9SS type A sorting domain-containing protein [Saprospiraceae bacterium]|nr:T9SS type A sorting domain-containing protein [Saprospiraceae bacterium]
MTSLEHSIKSIFRIFFFNVLFVSALFSQVYDPDRHNTSIEDTWISCQQSNSPNPVRGLSHWILYDLGFIHQLGPTHFWNLNVPEYLQSGINEIIIDVSENGSEWIQASIYSIPQAQGSGYYSGVSGPNLTGRNARYILITVSSNHGGPCAGFSEWKVYVSDPADPSYCNTESMDILDYPGQDSVAVQLTIISDWIIDPATHPDKIVFQAGESITLTPGFHAMHGANFRAFIYPCDPVSEAREIAERDTLPGRTLFFKHSIEGLELSVLPNVTSENTLLTITNEMTQPVKMLIFNQNGQLMETVLNQNALEPGIYPFQLSLRDYSPGMYYVQLVGEKGIKTERLVIVKN